jgi:predicted ATPase/tetratricopeptide (TPR) repeat protein
MSHTAPRTNLPIERGAFVGREQRMDDVSSALAQHRIVALHGPAGIGKTRLALRIAGRELSHASPPGGVWLVEMMDCTSAHDATRLLGLSFGLFPEPGAIDMQEERVARVLAERGPTLFVLDGVAMAPRLLLPMLQRLATLTHATFLLTTRDVLDGLPSSAQVAVGPLRLPREGADPRTLPSTEAVELFVERMAEARRVSRGGHNSSDEVIAAARIVRHLEGVPLAIELAAARCRVLTPAELLERLPRRVDLLGGRDPRGALAGAVAWSLELLSDDERAILAQAAIFHGGFTKDAAAQVLELHGPRPVVEVLDALLDKALIVPMPTQEDEDARYTLPASVRELVVSFRPVPKQARRPRTLEMPAHSLEQEPDARIVMGTTRAALVDRHAQYVLHRAGTLAENVDGHGGQAARRQLDAETDNLLAVVRRNLGDPAPQSGMVAQALVGLLALEPILTTKGPHDLLVRLLDHALPLAEQLQVPMPARLRSLEARARALRAQGQLDRSEVDLTTLLEQTTSFGDPTLLGRAWANLGTHHLLLGAWAQAEDCYAQALPILDKLRDKRLSARARGFIGLLQEERGDLPSAVECYEAAVAMHQKLGDRRFEAIHRAQLGRVTAELGGQELAEQHVRKAILSHRDLGARRQEGWALMILGDIVTATEDMLGATQHWQRAFSLLQASGDATGEALSSVRLAIFGNDAKAQEACAFALQRTQDVRARAAVQVLRTRTVHAAGGGVHERAAARLVQVVAR